LRILLADYPPPPMPLSVLYPHSQQLSSRVRVFAQWPGEIFEAVN
jgi:DNA-binding transcriptional LysR family regulator